MRTDPAPRNTSIGSWWVRRLGVSWVEVLVVETLVCQPIDDPARALGGAVRLSFLRKEQGSGVPVLQGFGEPRRKRIHYSVLGKVVVKAPDVEPRYVKRRRTKPARPSQDVVEKARPALVVPPKHPLATGRLGSVQDIHADLIREAYDFISHWTHIVGTSDGDLPSAMRSRPEANCRNQFGKALRLGMLAKNFAQHILLHH